LLKGNRLKSLTRIFIITLVLLILSCKDNVRVIEPSSNHPSSKITLRLDNTPPEISLVIARLSRNGFPDLTLFLNTYDSTHSAEGIFESVAIGTWHLRVDAYDNSNIARYTGEANVNVFPGETTQVNLELLPTSGVVDIHVTWGNGFNASGLMLYFPFDGSLYDSSGNNNHGTANYLSYTADKWENPNSAYLLNGVNNYITVPNSASLNPVHQLTIAFWLRVDSIQSNYMEIITKCGPVYGYFNNREYLIDTKQNYELWYPQLKSAGDGGGMHELDSGHHSYYVGQWNYFTFIVDRVNHRMQIYADGVLTEETNDSYSSFNVNSFPLIIGWSQEDLYEHTPLRAAIDNVRIYNKALTPSQVYSLYTSHK